MRNHRVSKDRNEDVERTWKTHRIRGSRWRGQDDSIAGAVCRSTNSRCENIVAVVSRKGDRHAGESHLPDTSSAGIVLSKHLERGEVSPNEIDTFAGLSNEYADLASAQSAVCHVERLRNDASLEDVLNNVLNLIGPSN